MNKSSLIFITMLLLAPVAALFAQEHTIDVDTKIDGDKKIVKIRKSADAHDVLQLTDTQKKDFKKLDLAFEKETLSKRNDLGIKKLELEIELEADNPDLKKINDLIDAIHKTEGDIEKSRIATEFKKRDLLTDEQKKNWKIKGPQHIRKEIMMFNDDPSDHLIWFGDQDMPMPLVPETEETIEYHEK